MTRHQRLDLRQRSNTYLLITNEANDKISEKSNSEQTRIYIS